MLNLRHPSRLVVLRRSSIWKKGTGEDELLCGGPPGSDATTCSTDHGVCGLELFRRPWGILAESQLATGVKLACITGFVSVDSHINCDAEKCGR